MKIDYNSDVNMEITSSQTGSRLVYGKDYTKFLAAELNKTVQHKEWILITDDNVFSYYGSKLTAILSEIGIFLGSIVFSAGERNKNLKTLNFIYDELILKGANRHTTIVALGGGVVGDIAGMAAATYMRGVEYVQIPTTLMAQIDSSIGGKTAIDLPQGKNLVGAFHYPKLIFTDSAFLRTLPSVEYIGGLAELLKYALIDGEAFLKFLEKEKKEIKAGCLSGLGKAIKKSIKLKLAFVEKDTHDIGERQFLNLGHTFAHALENATGYERYSHGESVAIGLVFALKLSEKHFGYQQIGSQRVEELLKYWDLPVRYDNVSVELIMAAMKKDKKNKDGQINFVLLPQIGKCELVSVVKEKEIRFLLKDMAMRT